MTLFTIGWIVLFVAGGALEAVALFNQKHGDTLSEHTWKLLERRWLRVVFVCGFAWLGIHLATGWV